MSLLRPHPRLTISHGPKKKIEFEQPPNLGNLTPDIQACSPPTFVKADNRHIRKIGKYLVHYDSSERSGNCFAIDETTGEEFHCKVLPILRYRQTLLPLWHIDGHRGVVEIVEIILSEDLAYVFLPRNYGDLHSYVRQKKRLREEEARSLAHQVIEVVRHCHENGVILRDLKLRKFVFKDPERTELRLEGLEDAVVLDDSEASDLLTDKHGCPAYVSPEILSACEGYSGKSADLWSLGVMIFTMLVGRYPFHDPEPLALFGKIRSGHYKVPEMLPHRAKCLIRNLLRLEPSERLSAAEALEHPWFKTRGRFLEHASLSSSSSSSGSSLSKKSPAQVVPGSESEVASRSDIFSFW